MDALNNLRESANANSRMLIVDDEAGVCLLMKEWLTQAGFYCQTALSGEEALVILQQQEFDALICGLRLPGVSGLALLEATRAKYPWMSFLIATAVYDVRVGNQAMQAGADDYLVKPFQLDEVVTALNRAIQRKRHEREVENQRKNLEQMVEQRTRQLRVAMKRTEKTCNDTLEALSTALDLRDSETAAHSRRVTRYCLEIAKALGCSSEQLKTMARGAYLHDIGKIGIPDAILLKPGKLTEEERAIMETHVRIGYEMMRSIAFMASSAEILLAHHERFDGTGYPQGLKGDGIPLGARIVAVAEAFDVMVWDQPYRSARTFEDALAELRRCSGTQFDPKVVTAFLDWLQIPSGPREQP
jgi:putative nucleotidyltransferase with HDIG domain